MYAEFDLHPSYGFLEDFLKKKIPENLPFMSPRQPIKLSDLDKRHMKRIGRAVSEKKMFLNIVDDDDNGRRSKGRPIL